MMLLQCICLLLFYTQCESEYLHGSFEINWDNITYISKTQTTLQVVANALLTRQSLIHKKAFESLADLNANFVRFVPWFPYPRLGVAQLEPPSGKLLCGHLNGDSNNNNWTLSLSCPRTGSVIDDIQFASWGTPTGICGNFSLGSCHASNSLDIVSQICLNRSSCTIPVNTLTFINDPCYGIMKKFAVQVTCSTTDTSNDYEFSNWNFTLIDPIIDDFMSAVNPDKKANKTIINFSTIPNWMYANVSFGSGYTDSEYDCSWAYNEGKKLPPNGLQKIGEYYGHLVSYYKNGEMSDEYGNRYELADGKKYIIDTWEVLNEPEGEHTNTPQSYTAIYDSVVQNIWKFADPDHKIKFVGLALETHNNWQWYEYFLNISNHVSNDIPLDFISFHFYTWSNSRTDPNAFVSIFSSADTFIKEVENVTKIRDRLSPNTKIDIDEIGAMLKGDNTAAPDPVNIFWNAAGAFFTYLYANLIPLGIDVLGQSQLLGYPPMTHSQFPASPNGLQPQFASVSQLDWNTGIGNARYWTLKLLIDHLFVGDFLIESQFNCTESAAFFVQAFIDVSSKKKKVLFINKVNQNIIVSLLGIDGQLKMFNGGKLYSIDEESAFGPAM